MNLSAVSSQLAKVLIRRSDDKISPYLVGVTGGQGAGKSTICKHLASIFIEKEIPYLILSLDDFYLSKAERIALARKVHPLAKTRGVPGTHDVNLLSSVLRHFKSKNTIASLRLPSFSKSDDELLPPDEWSHYNGTPRIILLEGWCVGARSNFISSLPETIWEKENDQKGVWKNWSRSSARKYEIIWDSLDYLALLRQKNFNQVIQDRWSQETNSYNSDGKRQFRSKAEVRKFCSLYESWTLAIWNEIPQYADLILNCEPGFQYLWNDIK